MNDVRLTMEQMNSLSAEDLAHEPLMMTVPRTGAYFRLGQEASYRAHKEGRFPVPVIRIGGTLRVSRAAVAAALGVDLDAIKANGAA